MLSEQRQEVQEVCRAITSGGYTEMELAYISHAIKTARKRVSGSYRVGDRIRFIGGRPAYLEGVEAIVVGSTPTKVKVQVVPEDIKKAQRFGLTVVNCPVAGIAKVETPVASGVKKVEWKNEDARSRDADSEGPMWVDGKEITLGWYPRKFAEGYARSVGAEFAEV
jgi:hypothetical protein